MADVFISYAREDDAAAERVGRALEGCGFDIWRDPQIPAGPAFHNVIEQALASASCVLVLWSKASVTSDWVRDEATDGKDRGVLVSARLDDVRAPLGFRSLQVANLVAWDGSLDHPEFSRLLRGVEVHVTPQSRALANSLSASKDGVSPGPQPSAAAASPQFRPLVVQDERSTWRLSWRDRDPALHRLPEDLPKQLLASYRQVCDALRRETGKEPQFNAAHNIRHEIVWGLSPDQQVKFRLLGGMDGHPADQVLVLTDSRANRSTVQADTASGDRRRASAADQAIQELVNREVAPLPDPRIKAIVTLDAANRLLRFCELGRITIPVMSIGESYDAAGWDRFLGARQHAAISAEFNYRVDIPGAVHQSFTAPCTGVWAAYRGGRGTFAQLISQLSQPVCKTALFNGEVNRFSAKYAIAFLKTHLAGETGYEHLLTQGWAKTREAHIEFFSTEPFDAAASAGTFQYYAYQPGSSWFLSLRRGSTGAPEANVITESTETTATPKRRQSRTSRCTPCRPQGVQPQPRLPTDSAERCAMLSRRSVA